MQPLCKTKVQAPSSKSFISRQQRQSFPPLAGAFKPGPRDCTGCTPSEQALEVPEAMPKSVWEGGVMSYASNMGSMTGWEVSRGNPALDLECRFRKVVQGQELASAVPASGLCQQVIFPREYVSQGSPGRQSNRRHGHTDSLLGTSQAPCPRPNRGQNQPGLLPTQLPTPTPKTQAGAGTERGVKQAGGCRPPSSLQNRKPDS